MSDAGCGADTTEPYALRVIGDSMLPEFAHGHIIIVDPGLPIYQGAYVVLLQDEQVMFGQYHQNGPQEQLLYLNPTFQSVTLHKNYLVKGIITQRSSGRRKSIKHYDTPY
ncbi:MAG: S24 family peptidase [Thiohalomonadales bacterium]